MISRGYDPPFFRDMVPFRDLRNQFRRRLVLLFRGIGADIAGNDQVVQPVDLQFDGQIRDQLTSILAGVVLGPKWMSDRWRM